MYDLKQMQRCQLLILKEFDRLCKKNDLNYYLAFGTCLGAIRHNGFIPWDDDIDVCMPVEDFEVLCGLKDEFKYPFFFQTADTDPGFPNTIARIRNSETTLIEKETSHLDINHGVFIDIYPLFHCPSDSLVQKKKLLSSMLYRLFTAKTIPKNHGKIMKIGSKLILGLTTDETKKKIRRKAYQDLKNCYERKYYCSFYGDESKIRYESDVLFPTTLHKFEDDEYPVPANYDMYLKLTYGDYMMLPPREKQCVHHDFVYVDLNKSYKTYKGKYYCKL